LRLPSVVPNLLAGFQTVIAMWLYIHIRLSSRIQ